MVIREAQPADANGIARVHVDSWKSTYRGMVPDQYLAKLNYEAGELRWTRILTDAASRNTVFVAEAESGEIIGFAVCGPERESDPVYTGELYAIYLLAEQQGRGVGRLLVRAAAAKLRQAGHDKMLVWVLAENKSRHFYARLGARPVQSKSVEIGGAQLEEIGYAWDEISILL